MNGRAKRQETLPFLSKKLQCERVLGRNGNSSGSGSRGISSRGQSGPHHFPSSRLLAKLTPTSQTSHTVFYRMLRCQSRPGAKRGRIWSGSAATPTRHLSTVQQPCHPGLQITLNHVCCSYPGSQLEYTHTHKLVLSMQLIPHCAIRLLIFFLARLDGDGRLSRFAEEQ